MVSKHTLCRGCEVLIQDAAVHRFVNFFFAGLKVLQLLFVLLLLLSTSKVKIVVASFGLEVSKVLSELSLCVHHTVGGGEGLLREVRAFIGLLDSCLSLFLNLLEDPLTLDILLLFKAPRIFYVFSLKLLKAGYAQSRIVISVANRLGVPQGVGVIQVILSPLAGLLLIHSILQYFLFKLPFRPLSLALASHQVARHFYHVCIIQALSLFLPISNALLLSNLGFECLHILTDSANLGVEDPGLSVVFNPLFLFYLQGSPLLLRFLCHSAEHFCCLLYLLRN
mmetsp:Transcript_37985/g.98055  ORF Transcript_37985/g.98055 Transcript_37985/m.98055 type:complete len:281 (-) Transcript_37985:97-939(-)